MKKVFFGNAVYDEALDLDHDTGDYFYTTLIKGNNTVEQIANAVTGCDDIIVREYDDVTEELLGVEHYSNYIRFKSATLQKDFLIGVEFPDEEEEQPIYADVVEIVLGRDITYAYYISQTKTLSTSMNTEFTFQDDRIVAHSGNMFVNSSIPGFDPIGFDIRDGYAAITYPPFEEAVDLTCMIFSR